MSRDDIDSVVITIMMKDGPDRHINGHNIITDFIMAVIDNNGEEWFNQYKDYKGIVE